MRKHLLSAASVAVLGLSAATSAQAAPYLVLDLFDTAGGSVSCASTSAVCASGFTWGIDFSGEHFVSYSGLVGGYQTSVNSNFTNAPGTASFADVRTTYNSIRNNTSTGDFVLSATAFGFTLPAGPQMTLSGSASYSNNGSPAGQSIDAKFYANPNNASPLDGAGNPVAGTVSTGCLLTITVDADGCSSPHTLWTRTPGSDFSLQEVVRFDLNQFTPTNGVQPIQGGSNVIARTYVPEPVSTALVGIGLIGLGLFSRRRSVKA